VLSDVVGKALEYSDSNYEPLHAPSGAPNSTGGQFTSTNSGGGRAPLARGKLTYSGKRQGTQRSRSGSSATTPAAAAKNTTTLKMGKNNDPEAVKQLQALISELGLANVAVDGVIGPHTDAAIKAIQTKLGLAPTGSASPALVRRLKDAHTLSPCVDRAASQVTAAYDSSGSEEEHTGAMVALVPTDAAAAALAVEDGEPADELHCTLLYLGEAADYDDDARDAVTAAVADVAAGFAPFDADGFAISLFNPESDERDPCIVLGLSGAELADVHDAVAGEVEASPEQHEPWIPHITLVYDAEPEMVAELTDRTGPVRFDRIRVAFGDEVIDYPLAGGAPVAAGHPYPGQRYKHGWVPLRGPGPGLGGRSRGGGRRPEDLHDEATIRATFNLDDERTGLRARVKSISRNRSGTYVSAHILDGDGNVVGVVDHNIRPAAARIVDLAAIVLEPEHQKHGFARRYLAQLEDAFRQHGIEQIRLRTTEVGGYAWAKAGFSFGDFHSRRDVAERALEIGRRFSPEVQDQIRRVANNLNAEPIDFAMIGWVPGASTWPGKQIMLGSMWSGEKQL
jgi:2'-5' RNA ligase/GNAT superfamily N-acetyltransferase